MRRPVLIDRTRPEPSTSATAVSCCAIVAAVLAAFSAWMSSVFNTRPTTGTAFVDVAAIGVGTPTDGPVLGGEANVVLGRTVELEVWDSQVVSRYYLPHDLGYLAVVLACALVVLIATSVLVRRPASRAVAGGLVAYAAFAVAAAMVGPMAHDRAVARAVRLAEVPMSEAQARARGIDFFVDPAGGDWFEYRGAFLTLAVLSVGAALYVLHLRRLSHPRDSSRSIAKNGPVAIEVDESRGRAG